MKVLPKYRRNQEGMLQMPILTEDGIHSKERCSDDKKPGNRNGQIPIIISSPWLLSAMRYGSSIPYRLSFRPSILREMPNIAAAR